MATKTTLYMAAVRYSAEKNETKLCMSKFPLSAKDYAPENEPYEVKARWATGVDEKTFEAILALDEISDGKLMDFLRKLATESFRAGTSLA